jgi:hypothetical protein
VRRIVFHHFDIGHERRSREGAFQQVVAENSVFLDPTLQRRFHSVDMVEALTGERPLAEDVLIEIGHSEDIGVEPAIGRKHALEKR